MRGPGDKGHAQVSSVCIRPSRVPVDVQTALQYPGQVHAHLAALQGPQPGPVRRGQLSGRAEQQSG